MVDTISRLIEIPGSVVRDDHLKGMRCSAQNQEVMGLNPQSNNLGYVVLPKSNLNQIYHLPFGCVNKTALPTVQWSIF